MPRKYTKIEMLSDEIFRLKEHGKTHREIGDLYGLIKEQIKEFVNHQNRKQRLLKQGYVPRPKGRPRKNAVDERTPMERFSKFALVERISNTASNTSIAYPFKQDLIPFCHGSSECRAEDGPAVFEDDLDVYRFICEQDIECCAQVMGDEGNLFVDGAINGDVLVLE